MPVAVTRSSLRGRIRTRCRQPNPSGFISDEEINELIAEGAYELYDLLVRARGAEYYSTVYHFNTSVGGVDNPEVLSEYTLPSDFYRLVAIAISDTAGTVEATAFEGLFTTVPPEGAQWYEPLRFKAADFATQKSRVVTHPLDVRYALTGLQDSAQLFAETSALLRFYPAPLADWCVGLVYLPVLSIDEDEATEINFDGINGWETFIVAHACATIAGMQEEDAGLWLAQKAEVRERVAALGSDRDRAVPIQVADRRGSVRRGGGRWPERLPRP